MKKWLKKSQTFWEMICVGCHNHFWKWFFYFLIYWHIQTFWKMIEKNQWHQSKITEKTVKSINDLPKSRRLMKGKTKSFTVNWFPTAKCHRKRWFESADSLQLMTHDKEKTNSEKLKKKFTNSREDKEKKSWIKRK